VVVIPGVFYVAVQSRIFPFVDDWFYIDGVVQGPSWGFVKYLFALHNDHRIPIQKLLHAVVLWVDGYDFRYLIALNFATAGLTSAAFVLAARNYRGYSHLGDLLAPATLVAFGASYTYLAFNFQFLSGLLFLGLFLFFGTSYGKGGRPGYLTAALWMLAFCAWCGMNGAVLAAPCVLSVMVYMRSRRLKMHRAALIGTVAAVTSVVLQVALWRPSSASGVAPMTAHAALLWVYHMVSANLMQWATPDRALKTVALAALYVSAIVAYVRGRQYATFNGAILGGAFLAMGVLVLAVGAGRAPTSVPWTHSHDGHYGILVTALPVLCWMALSVALTVEARGFVAGATLVFFGVGALANFDFRMQMAREQAARFRAVQDAIASTKPAREIVDENLDALYFGDGSEAHRQFLTVNIEKLRAYGGRRYR
jgi:hypothetical protein